MISGEQAAAAGTTNPSGASSANPAITFARIGVMIGKMRTSAMHEHRTQKVPLTERDEQDYFFTPRIAPFATLATRNLTTVLAGILIFCRVLGLMPARAFLFCFTSLPKPGKTNSPFFLIAL
jgi:hypothetical protein